MWQYLHSHLAGVPDLPVVPEAERRTLRIVPCITKSKRPRHAAGHSSGEDSLEGGAAQRRRADGGAVERRRLEQRERAEAQRQQRERAQRVRARRQQEHTRLVAEAAEERRQRWADQQLRAQREAELVRHMGPCADAERRARRARFEQQRQCLRRAALRGAIRARIDLHDLGVMRSDVGSRRAKLLVKRARYLYGRTDMIHWLRCHGQLGL